MSAPASKTALIVAGDESNEAALVRLLRSDAYDLSFAPDRAATLAAASERTFDLIVVVAARSGDDPVELCRELRALDGTKQTAVALVSVETSLDYRVAALRAGVDEFIAKPLISSAVRALFNAAVQFKQQPGAELRRRRTARRSEAQ